jgi:ferredoxin
MVDPQICVSAGMCALTAPHIFTQDDTDGRGKLRTPQPSAEDPSTREAAQLCPSGAITIK